MNEFDIIQQYFKNLTNTRTDVELGIGDDCALLKPVQNQLIAVSTDTLVSGKHFFSDVDPVSIGHKSLAVNLSDLAAMGARPAWVSLALTLPEYNSDWLNKFSMGFGNLAKQFDLQLIGGDLTSGPTSITVTIQGLVDSSLVMKRSGAIAGDIICVSGLLGDAALALELIQSQQPIELMQQKALDFPDPRIDLGLAIAKIATSCVDISDGLLADLGHICEASACGAVVNLTEIPCSTVVSEVINLKDSWALPLTGGDDYELCFTINPKHLDQVIQIGKSLGVSVTSIGEIKTEAGVICLDNDSNVVENEYLGYKHFS